MMDSEGIGLMVWSPLAGGFLSGKYSRDGAKESDNRRATFDFPPVNEERGYTVIGAKKPEQLDDDIAATKVVLTDAELRTLDDISKLPAAYSGWVFDF